MALPEPIKTANAALRNFFKQSNPLAQEGDTWKLRNDSFASRTQDEKQREYTLWPMPPVRRDLQDKSLTYPFYLSFAMNFEANDSIKDVSIKVFREDTTQTIQGAFIPTELLLRAEWSNEALREIHAQPHWHIHAYHLVDRIGHLLPENQRAILELIEEQPQKKSIMDDEETIPVEQMAESKKVEFPSYRFHLSMLVDWHKEKNAPRTSVLDNETLKVWLPQCLQYIQEQLEYILGKLPN